MILKVNKRKIILILIILFVFLKTNTVFGWSANAVLPSYVEKEVLSAQTRVNELNNNGAFSFGYITDIHADHGTYSPIVNIEAFAKMRDRVLMKFGVCAGDITTGPYEDFKNGKALYNLSYYADILSPIHNITPVFFARGNHDCNTREDNSVAISGQKYYEAVLKRFNDNRVSNVIFDENNLGGDYYYKDFEDEKIRVCVLNAFNGSNYEFLFGENQLNFVANKMLNLSDKTNPEEWQVLFVTHTVDETVAHNEKPSDTEKLYSIINEFQEGKNNYASQGRGTVIAIITGHHHLDSTTIKNNLLIITVRSANVVLDREASSNEKYNEDDVSFDVFSIDKATKTLYATKVGRGNDRVWNYDINQLKEETANQRNYSLDESKDYINITTLTNHNNEKFAIVSSNVALQEKSNKTWILSQDRKTYIKVLNDVSSPYVTTFTNINGYSRTYAFNITKGAVDPLEYMFNSTYYADMNSDLKQAFGYDEEKLKNHYLQYGIKEGRKASPVFDVYYYLNNNVDLKQQFGNDYEKAYNHFINDGVYEGRASSNYFNSKTYLKCYSDLRTAFGDNNYIVAILHFAKCGISEGRKSNFDVLEFYNQCDENVKRQLGTNYIKYYALRQGAMLVDQSQKTGKIYVYPPKDAGYDSETGQNIVIPKKVPEYAFSNAQDAKIIVLREGIEAMDEFSLDYCHDLIQMTIPRSMNYIERDTFYSSRNITLRGYKSSYAEKYAYQNGIPFVAIDETPIDITNYMFDSDLYYSLYPDLQIAFGNNPTALRNHYYTCGLKEGRVASYIFDAPYYLNKFSDLKNAFGKTGYEAAYYHFINSGSKEGRTASPYFNVKYYLNSYPDLKNEFVDNYTRALEHFVTCGISEGRVASKVFNVKIYRNNYEDLKNAFGKNWKEYYKHYKVSGQREGRQAL